MLVMIRVSYNIYLDMNRLIYLDILLAMRRRNIGVHASTETVSSAEMIGSCCTCICFYYTKPVQGPRYCTIIIIELVLKGTSKPLQMKE